MLPFLTAHVVAIRVPYPCPLIHVQRRVTDMLCSPSADRVQKRASNVMKLAQENEKLKEELRAMNERLEAAERKQAELRRMEAQAAAAAQRSTKGAGKT